jgi:hypothetical protein
MQENKEQPVDLTNITMNDLMFKAIDHAVDSVSTGESLIPFVLTGTKIERFIADRLEDSVKQAEEYLLTKKDENVITLAYDGFITIQGEKFMAVFVKVYSKDESQGLLMVQRYQPKKFLRKFSTIGNPALVQYVPNILL